MIKVTDECLIHVGDIAYSDTGVGRVGIIQHNETCQFKIIKFDRTAVDMLSLDTIIFNYSHEGTQLFHVQMTPELYKERVLEQYHDSVRTAQSLFNCAEKRAKEICAQMLEAVNAN